MSDENKPKRVSQKNLLAQFVDGDESAPVRVSTNVRIAFDKVPSLYAMLDRIQNPTFENVSVEPHGESVALKARIVSGVDNSATEATAEEGKETKRDMGKSRLIRSLIVGRADDILVPAEKMPELFARAMKMDNPSYEDAKVVIDEATGSYAVRVKISYDK